ncbi:MAG: aminotransferase class IV [Gemmatimonadaceae bacterium]|nr:aminotransferase class IV [Gemmatimonadaceae bacterium]
MFVTINETIVDGTDLGISVIDRGFLLGDGVFETLRVYSGKPFRLDDHLRRLSEASVRTGIPLTDKVESVVLGEVERATGTGLRDALVRITLTRGTGFGLGANPGRATLVTMVDVLPVLNPDWYSRGIRVVTASGRRNEFAPSAGLKTTAYLDAILAFRAGRDNGADDAIFLDTRDHLSEATASNLFVVADGTLYTPPLECGALPGITRALVIELAKGAGIRVVANQTLEASVLRSATELFLTSSIREIVPVVSCDDFPIGSGAPGPVASQMVSAYAEVTRFSS